MDFTEVITALESGIIDGADASTLATNLNIGVYDVANPYLPKANVGTTRPSSYMSLVGGKAA